MFRKKNKSDVQTEYTCNVRFLDDEPAQFTFKKDAIGQWLLDRVAEKLNLMEKDYFGLRFVDSEKQRHWLDPLKTVYKQLKGVSPMVLCFRVKFYPEEPMKLHEEITRYYMYLQLRRDLHHGRLLAMPDDAVYLAAYIVQSEVGDYDPEDHPPGYISEFKMLPKQTPKLEDRVMEQHKALQGQVPSDAEYSFLKKASSLDTYGVDPHQVKDQKGDQLYLGITHQGIMTFRGSRRTQLYKWAHIRRIAYEGKMFVVHVNMTEENEASPSKKKQQPVGYKCQTAASAKYMWRCAVEQQLFFTLSSSNSAPKMRSGGTIFSRGSKFRFSGRCQSEAYEASERIHRQAPTFQRSTSLPNFARRNADSKRNSAIIGQRNSCAVDENSPEVIWATGKKPEAAVDVPVCLDVPYKPAMTLETRVIKAPLAPQETFDDQPQQPDFQQSETPPNHATELITATSAATTATAILPRLNGQVVSDTAEIAVTESGGEGDKSFDVEAYQPDTTFYGEEEEEVKEEEEIVDAQTALVEEVLQAEHNHVVQEATAPTQGKAPQKKSGGCGVCAIMLVSVLMALLLFAVFFYILFFSGLQHPALTEARNHLKFLEPARDIVAKRANGIVNYFMN